MGAADAGEVRVSVVAERGLDVGVVGGGVRVVGVGRGVLLLLHQLLALGGETRNLAVTCCLH